MNTGDIGGQKAGAPPATERVGDAEPTVAFCQQCGRALTRAGVRSLASGIYCEPCSAPVSRSQYAGADPGPLPHPGYAPVDHTGVAAGTPVPARPNKDEPNPLLAGLLGLIPGVGAMYNGQYAKAAVHLGIFVVLTSLADNLNWVLWWFVWGWVFYQAFEAYHTAQARRLGQSLPDHFGWNDLGDRLGFGRGQAGSGATQEAAPAKHASTPRTSAFSQSTAPNAAADMPSTDEPLTEFSGTGFPVPLSSNVSASSTMPEAMPVQQSSGPFAAAPPPLAEPISAGYRAPSETGGPFQPTYTDTYTGSVPEVNTASQLKISRFPAAAIWLIGFGLVFLAGNFMPTWHLSGRWLVPLLLAVVAVWIGAQRISAAKLHGQPDGTLDLPAVINNLVGAALLLTFAALLALQNGRVVGLRHSWPVVLIVWGGMLLLGRARPNATVSGR